MNILVLNCGSSSVKYKLINVDDKKTLAEGGVEKIGIPGSFLKFRLPDGSKKVIDEVIPDHRKAIMDILNILTDPTYGCISSFKEIDAVGHRVVHGGEKFNKSVLINDEVIEKIKECYDVAPLHNPVNMAGIDAITELMPGVPQVAVFDTAFHQTMPAEAYMYALPYELYTKYSVRRFGFHGTSHRYVARRVCDFLGVPYENQRIITCHIGNGGSITAVKDGKSIDTSMGLTPVEGLMMGTRVGDVDPGALTFIMDKEHLDTKQLSNLINKKSGVLGISGISSDMRDIDAAIAEGNERAKLALDMYIYRIIKYIGAYTAVLNGVDIIVFTGGVGENQQPLRKAVCEHLSYLGVKIDDAVNASSRGEEKVISAADSKVKVVVIPTDEELMIARDTEAIVNGRQPE
ncbi:MULTISPECIES: acetate/propionate family kinase [Muribaculum]|jgi:acetate kinase|uniref:acetate/propionate family kinase n=1 Tax=Muribaculum TaxID=1918540 RepID=UPI000F49CAA8|nr:MULTISPECIES: acetate kinase [Muribaculum]MCX4278247.1 acetate kinase [Muribaculum sp.]ROT12533.1 acetate kinase [Muribaculaceae bacterium Isolate-102 (HZI)]TGY02012.1 acetate kinase [Muribaculum sp. NM65_B17]THG40070.1 acetate kinase [Muribaculaceae bacterium]